MRKNSKVRIAWVVPLLVASALVVAVPYAYGWAGSQQIAWPGQPVTALPRWPAGVLELVNDTLRTEGWHPFFSGLANDLNHYVMNVRNSDDANRLITKFAAIKADKAQIRLNPGKEPVIEFTTVSEAEKGPAVFSVGNQAIIDQWFQRLPEAEPGVRKFGVHRYSEALVARPPTLTFYVGHEAIDLEKLEIPASVEVVPDIPASDRAKSKDDLLLKAIDDFVARHQATREAAAKAQMDQAHFEPASKDAFVVFGRVTDAQGQPMPGIEVCVHSGVGTLFGVGQTTTDTHGDYRLAFRAGYLMPRADTAPLGVGFQAATVTARKPGYFIQGLGRAGNLAMTDQTNTVPEWATNFAGIVRPFTPYQIDFALQPAAKVKGELVDPTGKLPAIRTLNLKGEKLPPSCSVLNSANLVAGNRFEFTEVPVGFEWWFEVEWREGEAWKSARAKPFAFRSPGEHRLTLKLTAQGELEMTEPTQSPTHE